MIVHKLQHPSGVMADIDINQQFRQRLLAGDRLYGTMVTLDAPAVVEILCHLGFDWLFLES